MLLILSTTGSKTKPKLNNLTFHTVDLQLEELKEKLGQGFTISGLYDHKGYFKNTGKGVLKNHYIGSYLINIDLDEESVPMEEKLEQIELLPTIAYKTFSNDDSKGKFRYRFIYVFDNIILGERNYEKIFNEICNVNHFNYDRNARVGYKLMCGTDKEVLITGKTYKLCDFKCNLNCDDCGLCMPVSTSSCQFQNQEFKKDFSTMPYAEIVAKYKGIYRNIQHSQLPYADDDTPVIELPEDFFELTRQWRKGMEKNEIVKIKNHCHRRIKLYNNLVIRRLITPTLTFDELIYNLCFEMAYFIDNSDRTDLITRQQLIGIAENAFIADTSKFNYIKPRKSMVNVKYMIKNNKSKVEVRNKHNAQKKSLIKEINSEMINRFYNPNLTIKENINYIEEMTGTRFSDRTIRNWKQENGLTRNYNSNSKEKSMKKYQRKKLTIEEQDEMYAQLSDKSIKSVMEAMKVSQRTAYRIIERNSATSTTQQPKTETPIVENFCKICDTQVTEIKDMKFLGVKSIAEKLNYGYNNGQIDFDEAFFKLNVAFENDEEYKKLAKNFGICLDDCWENDFEEYYVRVCRNLVLTDHEKEGLRNSQFVKVLEKIGCSADDFISNFEKYFNDYCQIYGWFDDYVYEYHFIHNNAVMDLFYYMVEWFNIAVRNREEVLENLVKRFIKKSFEGFG